MNGIELQFATEASRILVCHGVCRLEYATAQFEPYSSAQRPDLFFSPHSGPDRNDIFFTELRMPLNLTQTLPSPEVLEERRGFIEPEPLTNFGFALATTRRVDETYRQVLAARNIELFSEIKSGSDLARRVLSWSAVMRTAAIQQTVKGPVQLKMLDSPTIRLPLAARAQVRPTPAVSVVPAVTNISFPTNDEAFTGIFGRLAFAANGPIWRDNLIAFFQENHFGDLGRNLEFLRFLKRTLDAHKYKSPNSFSSANLTEWYRQFNQGLEVGSKF